MYTIVISLGDVTVVWDAMTVKASRLSKEKGDIMKADLCNGSQLLLLDKGDHYSAIVIPDTAGRKERRKVVKRKARIQDSDYEVEPKKLCSRESDVESMVSSTKLCLVWNNYCALAPLLHYIANKVQRKVAKQFIRQFYVFQRGYNIRGHKTTTPSQAYVHNYCI